MTEKELMNEAYEWRKHIKNLVTATDDELYHKRSKVFDWLIEQAEKVELLNAEKDLLQAKWEAQGLMIQKLHNQAEKVERYEKSIKECIERMNEGGAGTRSFVYEKLREVMEGEE
jgi:hypothetical protein